MNNLFLFITAFFLAYLVGSINFSVLLFRILKKEDPRKSHSGNAGTTNVYRQAGLYPAIVVLLLDAGRSMGIAFFAIKNLQIEYIPWIAFALVLGNRFPCFHNFKGGKGVANFLGFVIIAAPLSALVSAINWVVVYFIIKISFVASFFMVFVLSVGLILSCGMNIISISGSFATAVFIFYNHKKNISEFGETVHL